MNSPRLRVLELFSGTASFSRAARSRGHECLTVDIDPSCEPDICCDVRHLNVSDIHKCAEPFFPDVVWASPPCECFSTNTIGRNWNRDLTPKNARAAEALELISITFDWIRALRPRFFIIENPRAMLRKMSVVEGWPRKTVTYCQYGDYRMKPTDLWTNVPFEARCCTNGAPCHPSTPRGTYSRKSYRELSIVPPKLCEEIIIACEKENGKGREDDKN
jgi:hypothetical protein